jgi:hypothetical protein
MMSITMLERRPERRPLIVTETTVNMHYIDRSIRTEVGLYLGLFLRTKLQAYVIAL